MFGINDKLEKFAANLDKVGLAELDMANSASSENKLEAARHHLTVAGVLVGIAKAIKQSL